MYFKLLKSDKFSLPYNNMQQLFYGPSLTNENFLCKTNFPNKLNGTLAMVTSEWFYGCLEAVLEWSRAVSKWFWCDLWRSLGWLSNHLVSQVLDPTLVSFRNHCMNHFNLIKCAPFVYLKAWKAEGYDKFKILPWFS